MWAFVSRAQLGLVPCLPSASHSMWGHECLYLVYLVIFLCVSPIATLPVASHPSPTLSLLLSSLGPIYLLLLVLPAAPFPPPCFCVLSSRTWCGPSPLALAVRLLPGQLPLSLPTLTSPQAPRSISQAHHTCGHWLIWTVGARYLQVLTHFIFPNNSRSATRLYPFNS